MTPDDIWQETLLFAWRDRERFRYEGPAGFRSWLLAIATNRIRDAADRENAQKRGAGRAGELQLRHHSTSDGSWALTTTTPSRMAAYREEAEAMQSALAALPDRLRQVVALRVFEEVSIDGIASQLGLSAAAVRHRLREGSVLYRERLRRLLRRDSERIP